MVFNKKICSLKVYVLVQNCFFCILFYYENIYSLPFSLPISRFRSSMTLLLLNKSIAKGEYVRSDSRNDLAIELISLKVRLIFDVDKLLQVWIILTNDTFECRQLWNIHYVRRKKQLLSNQICSSVLSWKLKSVRSSKFPRDEVERTVRNSHLFYLQNQNWTLRL